MLRTHEDNFVGPRLLTYRPRTGAAFGRWASTIISCSVCETGRIHRRCKWKATEHLMLYKSWSLHMVLKTQQGSQCLLTREIRTFQNG